MNGPEDRLYELLPAVHRQRDFEQGEPLRALLRVIAEQVNAVEEDIGQLCDNWFIETCQGWVVPYLGDLIGYRPVPEAGRPGGADLNKALIPRREVANTLRYRRSKGTLALLELLARDVADWPARAVEFYKLLGFTQHMSHLRLDRGRTLDLRRGEALGHLGSPFTGPAYTASVGRHPGLSGAGLFVWRLRSYPITMAPACLVEKSAKNLFTFSVLCNDTPLFVRPVAEDDPSGIAGELNLPIPISRRAFEARKADYYGPDKSVHLWVGKKAQGFTESVLEPVPLERIVVADLSDWRYVPPKDKVAVDPETGRIVFPRDRRDKDVWVSYNYGFSADLGGGEYDRLLSQPAGASVIQVAKDGSVKRISEAIALAKDHPHAVIEITDSGFYAESIDVDLAKDQTLQIRAARRTRPVISLPELRVSATDALTVTGGAGSAFTLDGVMVVGRSVQVRGDLAALTLRHCTLVPGWGLENDCNPRWPNEPSLELFDLTAVRVVIERSIVGSIYVSQDEVGTDPIPLRISDSIVDATRPDELAVGAVEAAVAHVRLRVERCTVFGEVRVHALELGENSIFEGVIRVARRRIGCLRFSSYLPDADTRTPRRFECQPDLAGAGEEARVRPRFRGVRYGSPLYARLSDHCAEEIRRGADDQSEMGAFHHLYEPQRAANLRARLEEYTPAGGDADLIYADQEAP